MADRFAARRILPNLWEVRDARKNLVEYVLFAEYGLGHARAFVTVEQLEQPGARGEVLRELAWTATRAGIRHTFRPPPILPPAGPGLSVRPGQ